MPYDEGLQTLFRYDRFQGRLVANIPSVGNRKVGYQRELCTSASGTGDFHSLALDAPIRIDKGVTISPAKNAGLTHLFAKLSDLEQGPILKPFDRILWYFSTGGGVPLKTAIRPRSAISASAKQPTDILSK